MIGSYQADAMQRLQGYFSASWSGDHAVLGNLSGVFTSHSMNKKGDVPQYALDELTTQTAKFDNSLVARTSTENRPVNTAFAPRIVAF